MKNNIVDIPFPPYLYQYLKKFTVNGVLKVPDYFPIPKHTNNRNVNKYFELATHRKYPILKVETYVTHPLSLYCLIKYYNTIMYMDLFFTVDAQVMVYEQIKVAIAKWLKAKRISEDELKLETLLKKYQRRKSKSLSERLHLK